ncbi:50S ribosomal protein L20 [Puniceicoccus vermicola]|uniref:Large ribosomal subunit protein bL20 n=1 Tax=Puniceicoccus vermicola TaxID=388746 RepID=A0A7X1E3W8_9BACT|nr:50S ribosomal protein L20 [Puniceicoccus vermicola]MBC2601970.1 50S ribosomal protein L20 [Puniceicoccus vermicola]
MPRATNKPASRARRKKVIKKAQGYFGNKSRLFRYAKDAVDRGEKFAYRDRRKKKSEMRQLWIVRINAACRANGINYSRFMSGLRTAGIEMNRKVLSELAINDPAAFQGLVDQVKFGSSAEKAG